MSHIMEFSVAGLAGREGDYSQKLNRNVNIFFGENGSGKTSLLKILHSGITGEVEVLSRVPFKSATVDVYSINYGKTFHRSIKADEALPQTAIVSSDVNAWENYLMQPIYLGQPISLGVASPETKSGHLQYFLKGTPTWSIDPLPEPNFRGGFADRYLPTSRVYQGPITTPQVQFSGNTLSEAQLDAYFAESIKHLWTSYSADVGGAVSKAQQKGLANILKAILSTSEVRSRHVAEVPPTAYEIVSAFLSRQPGFSNVLGSPADFAKKYKGDPQLRSIVKDIETVEREVERATAPRELLKSLIQKMFSRKEVQFGDKDIQVETSSHTKIELSSLSSGEKQLLRIFIETLMAGPNTILIDEPELSMHIDWQRSLVSAMKQLNPEAQIIVATHSPEIMANLSEDVIFRL